MDKVLFSVEYDFNNTSVSFLWDLIATPDGLASWFADRVEANGKHFIFFWNDEKRCATQIALKIGSHIKLRWDDSTNKKCFFELKLTQNELTKNITLIVSDFADKTEIKDSIDLWDEQISLLRKKLGAY